MVMDWHRLAKALILGDDHRIHEREARILRREMLTDRVVDREETKFLLELHRAANAVDPVFDEFFCQVVKKAILQDGVVNDEEARWLRKVLLVDNKITPREVRLLEEIHQEARKVEGEFAALYREFVPARKA